MLVPQKTTGTILRISRTLIVTLVATCLSPAVGSSASATGSARPIELRTNNRIVGTETASIKVRITRTVRIQAPKGHAASPDVRIRGAGRVAGVALVASDWEDALGPEDFLIASRWGLCKEEGCSPKGRVIHSFRGLQDKRNRAVLPAGDYILHILADRAPVEVLLNLRGAPRGFREIEPRAPSQIDFRAPEPTLGLDAAGSYTYGAGSDYYAGRDGVSLSLLYVRARRKLNPFSGGICHIDSPTGPPDGTYGPQCYALTAAGLGKGFYLINENIDDREFALLPEIGYHSQGIKPPNVDDKRGLGAWALTPYPLQDFLFMGFFMEAP